MCSLSSRLGLSIHLGPHEEELLEAVHWELLVNSSVMQNVGKAANRPAKIRN